MPDPVRSDQPRLNHCSVYEPCVAVIVQGSKRVLLGDQTLNHGEDRYLIASMDLPVKTTILQASPERPYLGVALRLDWREIASLMLDTPAAASKRGALDSRAMATGAITDPPLDAFDRLLALLDQPEHIRTLALLVQGEIHYRLLADEVGARLRQIATVDTQSHQVARAMASLNTRFSQGLRMYELAREAGMSVSTFHQHFWQLTAMSPLQYQKQLCLTEARRLMLSRGLDAATAAFHVGYESPSQFIREYRRLFGVPPARDMAGIRWQTESAISLMAPSALPARSCTGPDNVIMNAHRRHLTQGMTAALCAPWAFASAQTVTGLSAGSRAAGVCPPLLNHRFARLQDDAPQDLCQFAGKVLLVVNTASYCGFTRQYEGLEGLYARYAARGLVVMGFPSNDFGQQEPGDAKQIAQLCFNTYGVKFPMFAKTVVKGTARHALYAQLAAATNAAPQWNFHKYLVARDGRTVRSFASEVEPGSAELTKAIEAALQAAG